MKVKVFRVLHLEGQGMMYMETAKAMPHMMIVVVVVVVD